jgi:hypothetical protein
MRWTWLVVIGVVAASGCKKSKHEKKLDGPMPIAFGDCAGATTAWVSGPRPAPFTPADADFVWVEDPSTKTASGGGANAGRASMDDLAKDDPPPPEEEERPSDEGTGPGAALEEMTEQRRQAIEQARAAGILGSSAQAKGGAFASLTATGDISSGFDDIDIYGGLLGGAESGMGGGGYESSPIGPGGAVGFGTIGTGRYGTIGHGSTGTGARRGGMRPQDPKLPTIELGQFNAQGDLDKAIIRRYIKRHLQKILYCYEKELLAKPNLEGTVSVQFFITPKGDVASSSASGVDKTVATCIADVVKSIAFPEPKGGGGVQVNYPFIFRPTGDGSSPSGSAAGSAAPTAPTDTDVTGGSAATGTRPGAAAPPSPTARRRLFRERGAYDRKYKAGVATPLDASAKEIEDCLRLGTQRHGVAVVELTYDAGTSKVSDARVHGIDDKRVAECIGRAIKKTATAPGRRAERCSFSYGEMPLANLPALDITPTAVMLGTRELARVQELAVKTLDSTVPAITDAVKARVAATTSQTAPVVAVHGPLVIRPVDATPMMIVKRAIASVLSGGDDFVLAAQQAGAWQLIEPLALPVVPVPFGTGGRWNHVGASASTPGDNGWFAILIEADRVRIGSSGGTFEDVPTKAEPSVVRDALKRLREQGATTVIRIGVRDEVTYGAFVGLVRAAIEAGFTDWQIVNASAIQLRSP